MTSVCTHGPPEACHKHAVRSRDPSLLFEAASLAHGAGDNDGALRSLRAALGIAPRFGGAYFELANCLFAPLQTAAIAGEPLDDAAAAAAAEDSFRAAIAVGDTFWIN